MTVAEAARVLGLTPDAVRMRLKRGALAGEKRGSEWIVHLPAPETGTEQAAEHHRTSTEQTSEQTTEQVGPPWAALVAAKDETISHLAAENGYLRAELAARSRELADERERSDVLHREAFARIEAITAGMPPAGDSDDASETSLDGSELSHDRDVGPRATIAPSPSNESFAEPSGDHRTRFSRWWSWISGS